MVGEASDRDPDIDTSGATVVPSRARSAGPVAMQGRGRARDDSW
jgi:hypothetical protein